MPITLFSTLNFNYDRPGSPGMTVRRQGLLVTLSGDFRVVPANYIGSYRQWGTLPAEFRPPSQQLLPTIGANGGIVMLRIDTDGNMWIAGGTGVGGTHSGAFDIFVSVVWVAAP